MSDFKAKPIPSLSQSDIERFWSKVVKGEQDECWPWFGGTSADGYGKFAFGRSALKAHRVSYVLSNGKDCDPLLIRHACDNKWCVNPNHLVPGTHKQNSQDAVERGRHNIEFAKKLTAEQVANVLADRAAGMSIPKLCAKYQITQGAIIPIIKGKTWKYLQGPREEQKRHLSAEDRTIIRARRAQGETLKSLAKDFNMSVSAIGMLCQGITWAADAA